MSKIYADTIETENSNVDITLGASGDAVLIPSGATLKTNKIFDAGGNNIITSDGSGNLTINSSLGSQEILILSQTASNSASVSFTADIDSTYEAYKFVYVSINPATNNTDFMFNGSIDGGSNYNVTKTTTMWRAYHGEDDAYSGLTYDTSYDRDQSTDYQWLCYDIGNESYESASGELYIFNPSSTTYETHFHATTAMTEASGYVINNFAAGYFDSASAINAVNFKMDSGNFDGFITMYGYKIT